MQVEKNTSTEILNGRGMPFDARECAEEMLKRVEIIVEEPLAHNFWMAVIPSEDIDKCCGKVKVNSPTYIVMGELSCTIFEKNLFPGRNARVVAIQKKSAQDNPDMFLTMDTRPHVCGESCFSPSSKFNFLKVPESRM